MNAIQQSRQVIEQLIPQLETDGYQVYFAPARELLPPFMQGYVPDAIALGPTKKLAIEVIVDGAPSKPNADDLKRLFDGSKDWELRVYYVRPTSTQETVPPTSRTAIEKSIGAVENLVTESQTAPALLMAWATFEALARTLRPEAFTRPQSPGRLVEVLAGDGHITPSEADLLRRLTKLRNQLIHGNLEQRIDVGELHRFIEVLKVLLALPQEAEG